MTASTLTTPERPLSLQDRLLHAHEVGKLLGLPVSTVYQLARTGQLPCLRIGRAVRFAREDLAAHLARARQDAR